MDPTQFTGKLVRKSEANGAHDGRIIEAPCAAEPGFVYQRVIDNSIAGERVEDLRCPTVGGKIPLVILKRRPISNRFANSNESVEVVETHTVLSALEQARLAEFALAMQLAWAGLDVLRDKTAGPVYVLDVNTPATGPPIAMTPYYKPRVPHPLPAALLALLPPPPLLPALTL